MGINASITDGKNNLSITPEGLAEVILHPRPPLRSQVETIPFRRYFTLGGDLNATNDMRVDGSSDDIEFKVIAAADRDTFIKSVGIVISDAGAPLNEFGNIGELTNGVEFFWSSVEEGKVVIHEGLTTNFSFVRLSGGSPAYASGSNAFRSNNMSGNSEGYFVHLYMDNIFGLPWGVRLSAATTESLTFNIRDNIVGVDQFDAVAYGVSQRSKSNRTSRFN